MKQTTQNIEMIQVDWVVNLSRGYVFLFVERPTGMRKARVSSIELFTELATNATWRMLLNLRRS